MKKLSFFSSLLLTVLLLSACASSSKVDTAVPATPEEGLMQQALEARGGVENLMAVESVVMSGTVNVMDNDLPLKLIQKRPNSIRTEVVVEMMGLDIISAYNGEKGWSHNPMVRQDAYELSGTELSTIRDMADIDGFLMKPEEKGLVVSLEGEEEVRGKPAQVVKIVHSDREDPSYLYVDKETFLEVKMKGMGVDPQSGQPATIETFFSDYRDIDGIKLPFKMEIAIGGTVFQTVYLTEAVINGEVDDSIFEFPAE